MRVLIVEDEPYLAGAVRDGLQLGANAADMAGNGDLTLKLRHVIPTTSRSSTGRYR